MDLRQKRGRIEPAAVISDVPFDDAKFAELCCLHGSACRCISCKMASMHSRHEDSSDDLLALGQNFLHGKPPIRKCLYDLWCKELIGLLQHALIRNVLDKRGGVTLVTVIHDEFEQAMSTAKILENGLPIVLSGMKTLLETGETLADH